MAVRPRPAWAPYFEELVNSVSRAGDGTRTTQGTAWRGKRILPLAA